MSTRYLKKQGASIWKFIWIPTKLLFDITSKLIKSKRHELDQKKKKKSQEAQVQILPRILGLALICL